MRRRWLLRLAGTVLGAAVLLVVLSVAGADPAPVPLVLLVATCAALASLLVDALVGEEPAWQVELDRPAREDAGDPRLVGHVRLLESHATARTADPAVRERLGALADQALRQRHGLRRDDPAAAPLLGPELAAVLSGPARRLSLTEIDRCLTRIEEL